jgi:HK97 family phage major capsid protein
MTPMEKLAALTAEAAKLREKALEHPDDFTDADAERATAVAKEHGELTALVARQKSISDALAFAGPGSDPVASSDDDAPEGPRASSIGEAFVRSASYRSFRKDHPTGVGKGTPISIKANVGRMVRKVDPDPLNTPNAGNARAVRIGDVDDLVFRPPRRILDVITKGTTSLPWFQYRQIVTKVNNASLVNEALTSTGTDAAGGLKPLSTLTTTTAEAKAYTYADGLEITNQELSDDGIMSSIINSMLTENLDILTEDILLNGAGTADEPAGILATTGVLTQAFATDVPTTLRKSITKLITTSGATITGVLLNPADDEAFDLLKDTTGRYLGFGPFTSGPGSVWGIERIVSQSITPGQAIIGDFRTIQLLQLEPLAIEAFNQHKDYAQRNLVYIRAEKRAVQLIRNAAKLCIVDLTA